MNGIVKEYPDQSTAPTERHRGAIREVSFPLRGSSSNPAPTLRSTLHSDGIVLRCALLRGRPARNDISG